MTLRPEQRDELYGLIELLVEEQLDDAGNERLTGLLATSEEARWVYVTEMNLHAGMTWDCGMLTADEEDSGETVVSGQWLVASDPPSALIPHPSSIPPIVIDPTPAIHSPIGSFVFSHIAAAVILGIGLLIGLAWRISLPSSEGPVPAPQSIAQAIGRITALADCKWSKQGAGVRGQRSGEQVVSGQWPVASDPPSALRPPPFVKTVFLGDRFLVASGLMEITYDTGAKVILQGPCTYDIDSARGGYLAVGKLTAKIVASGQWPVASKTNQQKYESKSLITDHWPLTTALFSVRTPTAVVTDLGTEFGVEVESSGATRSHVFPGQGFARPLVQWDRGRG